MIGCKLKKNSVALDVVNFGESYDEKFDKLEALIDAVNSNDNSNIAHVPVRPDISQELIRLPIFTCHTHGGGGLAAAASSGSSVADFGDYDPNLDPELALEMSMEEERAREEAAAANSAAEEDAKRGNG